MQIQKSQEQTRCRSWTRQIMIGFECKFSEYSIDLLQSESIRRQVVEAVIESVRTDSKKRTVSPLLKETKAGVRKLENEKIVDLAGISTFAKRRFEETRVYWN